MTTNELITSLASLLGNIGTGLNAQILTELKLAQTQLERGPVLPWFLATEAYALSTVNEPKLALPVDFLREMEDGGFAVMVNNQFLAMCKHTLDDLREEFEGQATGQPAYYGLLGTQFWLFPTPDDAYRVQMHYYGKDTTLAVDDTGNLWSSHYPDLLIGLAGQNLCLHQRTLDIKPRFDEMVMAARQQLAIDQAAREVANMEMSFG